MEIINAIFTYYDKLLETVPITYQATISLVLLLILIWNIYQLIKSGHWIFVAILIFMLPGTWPAARKIGEFVWVIVQGLLMRISG